MFRKPYLTLVAAITLLLLTIAPVYAAPSLSLGSKSSYGLTGKIQVDQSCTADPIAYAGQACQWFLSFSFDFVRIQDDGHCSTIGDSACNFTEPITQVLLGGSVEWENLGSLTHTVTSNDTLNPGLPSFGSAPLFNGWFFSHTFDHTGTYHYYDANYHWMTGTVQVNPLPPPPPPPPPTSNHVDLSGIVGWNVEGLSSDQANLNVSHQVSILVPSPIPGISFTPVTESGNFEQSINLSTRVESPSTSVSLVRSFLTSLLAATSSRGGFVAGGPGSVFPTTLLGQSNIPDHTMWWVNGPLSMGSPVQIFHGWSSVTGSENLNLGTTIGTRSAWIVTSQLSQTLSVTMPNQNDPFGQPSTAMLAASLKLLWSYDKNADLLLRSNSTINLTAQNTAPTTILAQVPCLTNFCLVPVSVSVTRNMALSISLASHLSSTTVHLPGSPVQTSTLMSLLSALPWIPLGIGGLAAGVAVALIVWLTRRARGTAVPGPAPTTAPAPGPPTPA